MPLEYAGGGRAGRARRRPRRRSGSSTSATSARPRSAARAPRLREPLPDRDLGKIAPGQAQYTLFCTDDGGVVDDLIAYLRADDEVFLIPNAANCATVVELLADAAPAGVEVANRHPDYAVLAVQGTRVRRGPGSGRASRPDTTTCRFVDVDRAGAVDGLPHRLHRRAGLRAGRAGRGGRGRLGRAAGGRRAVRAAAGRARRPRHAAHRDGLSAARPGHLAGDHPGPGPAGWAVGWKKDDFFGDAALRAEKEAGPARMLRGLRPSAGASRGPA